MNRDCVGVEILHLEFCTACKKGIYFTKFHKNVLQQRAFILFSCYFTKYTYSNFTIQKDILKILPCIICVLDSYLKCKAFQLFVRNKNHSVYFCKRNSICSYNMNLNRKWLRRHFLCGLYKNPPSINLSWNFNQYQISWNFLSVVLEIDRKILYIDKIYRGSFSKKGRFLISFNV